MDDPLDLLRLRDLTRPLKHFIVRSVFYQGEYRTGVEAALFRMWPSANFTRRPSWFFCKQTQSFQEFPWSLTSKNYGILYQKLRQHKYGKPPSLLISESAGDLFYTSNVFDKSLQCFY